MYQLNGGSNARIKGDFFSRLLQGVRFKERRENRCNVYRLTVILVDRFAPEKFACWDLSAVRICNKGKVM